jgi:hypothetical protein
MSAFSDWNGPSGGGGSLPQLQVLEQLLSEINTVKQQLAVLTQDVGAHKSTNILNPSGQNAHGTSTNPWDTKAEAANVYTKAQMDSQTGYTQAKGPLQAQLDNVVNVADAEVSAHNASKPETATFENRAHQDLWNLIAKLHGVATTAQVGSTPTVHAAIDDALRQFMDSIDQNFETVLLEVSKIQATAGSISVESDIVFHKILNALADLYVSSFINFDNWDKINAPIRRVEILPRDGSPYPENGDQVYLLGYLDERFYQNMVAPKAFSFFVKFINTVRFDLHINGTAGFDTAGNAFGTLDVLTSKDFESFLKVGLYTSTDSSAGKHIWIGVTMPSDVDLDITVPGYDDSGLEFYCAGINAEPQRATVVKPNGTIHPVGRTLTIVDKENFSVSAITTEHITSHEGADIIRAGDAELFVGDLTTQMELQSLDRPLVGDTHGYHHMAYLEDVASSIVWQRDIVVLANSLTHINSLRVWLDAEGHVVGPDDPRAVTQVPGFYTQDPSKADTDGYQFGFDGRDEVALVKSSGRVEDIPDGSARVPLPEVGQKTTIYLKDVSITGVPDIGETLYSTINSKYARIEETPTPETMVVLGINEEDLFDYTDPAYVRWDKKTGEFTQANEDIIPVPRSSDNFISWVTYQWYGYYKESPEAEWYEPSYILWQARNEKPEQGGVAWSSVALNFNVVASVGRSSERLDKDVGAKTTVDKFAVTQLSGAPVQKGTLVVDDAGTLGVITNDEDVYYDIVTLTSMLASQTQIWKLNNITLDTKGSRITSFNTSNLQAITTTIAPEIIVGALVFDDAYSIGVIMSAEAENVVAAYTVSSSGSAVAFNMADLDSPDELPVTSGDVRSFPKSAFSIRFGDTIDVGTYVQHRQAVGVISGDNGAGEWDVTTIANNWTVAFYSIAGQTAVKLIVGFTVNVPVTAFQPIDPALPNRDAIKHGALVYDADGNLGLVTGEDAGAGTVSVYGLTNAGRWDTVGVDSTVQFSASVGANVSFTADKFTELLNVSAYITDRVLLPGTRVVDRYGREARLYNSVTAGTTENAMVITIGTYDLATVASFPIQDNNLNPWGILRGGFDEDNTIDLSSVVGALRKYGGTRVGRGTLITDGFGTVAVVVSITGSPLMPDTITYRIISLGGPEIYTYYGGSRTLPPLSTTVGGTVTVIGTDSAALMANAVSLSGYMLPMADSSEIVPAGTLFVDTVSGIVAVLANAVEYSLGNPTANLTTIVGPSGMNDVALLNGMVSTTSSAAVTLAATLGTSFIGNLWPSSIYTVASGAMRRGALITLPHGGEAVVGSVDADGLITSARVTRTGAGYVWTLANYTLSQTIGGVTSAPPSSMNLLPSAVSGFLAWPGVGNMVVDASGTVGVVINVYASGGSISAASMQTIARSRTAATTVAVSSVPLSSQTDNIVTVGKDAVSFRIGDEIGVGTTVYDDFGNQGFIEAEVSETEWSVRTMTPTFLNNFHAYTEALAPALGSETVVPLDDITPFHIDSPVTKSMIVVDSTWAMGMVSDINEETGEATVQTISASKMAHTSSATTTAVLTVTIGATQQVAKSACTPLAGDPVQVSTYVFDADGTMGVIMGEYNSVTWLVQTASVSTGNPITSMAYLSAGHALNPAVNGQTTVTRAWVLPTFGGSPQPGTLVTDEVGTMGTIVGVQPGPDTYVIQTITSEAAAHTSSATTTTVLLTTIAASQQVPKNTCTLLVGDPIQPSTYVFDANGTMGVIVSEFNASNWLVQTASVSTSNPITSMAYLDGDHALNTPVNSVTTVNQSWITPTYGGAPMVGTIVSDSDGTVGVISGVQTAAGTYTVTTMIAESESHTSTATTTATLPVTVGGTQQVAKSACTLLVGDPVQISSYVFDGDGTMGVIVSEFNVSTWLIQTIGVSNSSPITSMAYLSTGHVLNTPVNSQTTVTQSWVTPTYGASPQLGTIVSDEDGTLGVLSAVQSAAGTYTVTTMIAEAESHTSTATTTVILPVTLGGTQQVAKTAVMLLVGDTVQVSSYVFDNDGTMGVIISEFNASTWLIQTIGVSNSSPITSMAYLSTGHLLDNKVNSQSTVTQSWVVPTFGASPQLGTLMSDSAGTLGVLSGIQPGASTYTVTTISSDSTNATYVSTIAYSGDEYAVNGFFRLKPSVSSPSDIPIVMRLDYSVGSTAYSFTREVTVKVNRTDNGDLYPVYSASPDADGLVNRTKMLVRNNTETGDTDVLFFSNTAFDLNASSETFTYNLGEIADAAFDFIETPTNLDTFYICSPKFTGPDIFYIGEIYDASAVRYVINPDRSGDFNYPLNPDFDLALLQEYKSFVYDSNGTFARIGSAQYDSANNTYRISYTPVTSPYMAYNTAQHVVHVDSAYAGGTGISPDGSPRRPFPNIGEAFSYIGAGRAAGEKFIIRCAPGTYGPFTNINVNTANVMVCGDAPVAEGSYDYALESNTGVLITGDCVITKARNISFSGVAFSGSITLNDTDGDAVFTDCLLRTVTAKTNAVMFNRCYTSTDTAQSMTYIKTGVMTYCEITNCRFLYFGADFGDPSIPMTGTGTPILVLSNSYFGPTSSLDGAGIRTHMMLITRIEDCERVCLDDNYTEDLVLATKIYWFSNTQFVGSTAMPAGMVINWNMPSANYSVRILSERDSYVTVSENVQDGAALAPVQINLIGSGTKVVRLDGLNYLEAGSTINPAEAVQAPVCGTTSKTVLDPKTRDGYAAAGTMLEQQLDGISAALYVTYETVTY